MPPTIPQRGGPGGLKRSHLSGKTIGKQGAKRHRYAAVFIDRVSWRPFVDNNNRQENHQGLHSRNHETRNSVRERRWLGTTKSISFLELEFAGSGGLQKRQAACLILCPTLPFGLLFPCFQHLFLGFACNGHLISVSVSGVFGIVLNNRESQLTKLGNRRLARRGGVKRISGTIYEEARLAIKTYLTSVRPNEQRPLGGGPVES